MNFFSLGSHPVNLLFRFLLELIVLGVIGVWCWKTVEGWSGIILAFVIPFAMAVIWGSFAVPEDPSRSGKSPVPTPGPLRLLLELSFFAFAIWCLFDLGVSVFAKSFAMLVLVHYVISADRIKWLLKKIPRR